MEKGKLIIVVVIIAIIIAGLFAYYLLIHTKPDGKLKEKYRQFMTELAERKMQGYDVVETEYYVLSALYYYRLGKYEKAIELFSKAEESLKNAELLPALQERTWTIAENNVALNRTPTVWDFVPIDGVFVKTNKGYLAYPRNDRKWKLSCFIIIAMGEFENGQPFICQGRLPLIPEEGPFRPRFYINGRWIILNTTFVGPLYFDEREKYGLPTVYQYDLSGDYLQRLSYDEKSRSWIHVIESISDNRKILEIKAKALGLPMWLGEWNGSFLVHGVYPRTRDLDLWAGFWDICNMTATLSLRKGEIHHIKGIFIFDRASHRTYYSEKSPKSGPPLAFSCIVIHQKEFTLMMTHSFNPSSLETEYKFEHQIRLNIYSLNLSITTTNFEFSDEGSIQPSEFILTGQFENGYFNLTGQVFGYWPEKWATGKGTWWNMKGVYTWGRAFTKWTGIIAVGNQTIYVNAWSAGEYTRYGEKSVKTTECNIGDNCWGRWGEYNIKHMFDED